MSYKQASKHLSNGNDEDNSMKGSLSDNEQDTPNEQSKYSESEAHSASKES